MAKEAKFPKFNEKRAKPYTPPQGEKEFPPLDEGAGYDVYNPPINPPSSGQSALDTLKSVSTGLDVPGSAVRSLVGDGMEGGETYLRNIRDKGIAHAVQSSPTGEDLLDEYDLMQDSHPYLKTAAGVGAEMITDPTIIFSAGKKALQMAGKQVGKSFGQRASTLARNAAEPYIEGQTASALSRIKPVTEGMQNVGFDTEKVASRMFEDDLTKYITNPVKLLEKINGTRRIKKTPAAGGKIITREAAHGKKGLISEISDDLADVVQQVSGEGFSNVKGKSVRDPVSSEFMEESSKKISGTRYTDGELMNIDERINSLIDSDSYTLNEVFLLKKNLGKKLANKAFYAPESAPLMKEKEVMLNLQRRLDDVLKEKLSIAQVKNKKGELVNAGEFYDLQNNRMHLLIKLKDMLKSIPEKELRKTDIGAALTNIGVTGSIYAGVGLGAQAMGLQHGGMVGASLGVAHQTANELRQGIRAGYPAWSARTAEAVTDIPEIAVPLSPQIQRMATEGDRGRSPDSIAMQLIETKLPRSTEGLMENKEIVLAKIAQQMPNYFDHFKFILENRPQDLEEMLPVLIDQIPHAFESDKYGRVNGMIMNPMLRDKARKDIMNDDRFSNTKSMDMISKMNKTGYLEDF